MGRGKPERRNAGKDRRGRIRRLIDKSIKPAKRTYQPPPANVCKQEVFHTYPTGDDNDDHRITIRLRFYKGRLVDFSLNQSVLVDRTWKDVARIDCCGGTIHRHQFDRDGRDLIGHELIKEIPPEDGWSVIEEGYQPAYDVMHDEWEGNLQRWSR